MRITGSCGIRLACPSCLLGAVVSVPLGDAGCARPASRAVGRLASRSCLLDVIRRMPRRFAPSSHRSRAWLRASLCVPSARASPLLRPVIDVDACAAAVPWLLATRPASSTRRAGRYDGAVAVPSALLACPSARHPTRAVRHRMATGFGACLVRLPHACPRSVSRRCRLLSSRSPIRFPCRPAASSPSLPDRSTRGTGRGLLPSTACLCGSFAIAVRFRLRSICAGSVEDGGGGCFACLGVVLCMLSMG